MTYNLLNPKRAILGLLDKFFVIAFAATLIVINIIRIIRIPVTFDEPNYCPTDGYLHIMADRFGSGNNHILHSVFRKFFIELFGYNLFSHRLDSLIAQCLFLLFSWLLCRLLFKNISWQLCSFVLLNVISPFIFDFWGLGRGYALALAFMTISIYYLLRYLQVNRIFFLSIAFACAILSVYSNFGYINYYISLSGVIIIQNIIFRKGAKTRGMIKEFSVLFIASCILALMITVPLMSVYKNGELSYLGNNGFINDTIMSLVKDGLFLPSSSVIIINIITGSVVVLTWLAGFYWLYVYLKKSNNKIELIAIENKYGITLFLLLIIPAISLIAQHLLFGINYLTDRTALFFIILFILQLIYWLYYLRHVIPTLSLGLLIGVFLIAGYNFTSKINLRSTHLWWFNADDLAVLKRITDESKNKQGKIKLHVYWYFVPTLNFDIQQKYKGLFDAISDNRETLGKDTSYDFYYVASSDNVDTLSLRYHKDSAFVGGCFILYKKN